MSLLGKWVCALVGEGTKAGMRYGLTADPALEKLPCRVPPQG